MVISALHSSKIQVRLGFQLKPTAPNKREKTLTLPTKKSFPNYPPWNNHFGYPQSIVKKPNGDPKLIIPCASKVVGNTGPRVTKVENDKDSIWPFKRPRSRWKGFSYQNYGLSLTYPLNAPWVTHWRPESKVKSLLEKNNSSHLSSSHSLFISLLISVNDNPCNDNDLIRPCSQTATRYVFGD